MRGSLRHFLRCVLGILVLMCHPLSLKAQDEGWTVADRLQLREYLPEDSAVVDLDHNFLLFPGGGRQDFDSLLYRLTHLRHDPSLGLRVLHIGGSHVQADLFSGRMRQNLGAFTPGLPVGRGVMFPFSVMGTNGPKDYTYTSTGRWGKARNIEKSPAVPLGLSGAAITTTDLTSTLTLSCQHPFESVVLYGRSLSDTAWVYPVLIAGADTLYPPRSMDTSGYEFLFSHPVRQCTMALQGDSCGGFIFRGMVADPYAEGIVYTSSGINGAAVPSWLRCETFEDELQALSPDLVLLGIGINDANVQDFSPEQFKQNYRELLQRIRRVSPGCAFIFMVNNDCYLNVGRRRKSFNRNTEKVEQAFMDLAAEYHGAVWDLYQIMGGYGSSARWVKQGYMRSDHIHFTQKGYELLGDLLYNALVHSIVSYNSIP